VVPETLEPSLQLASAVLSQLNMPAEEVAQVIKSFRKNHVAELQVRGGAVGGGHGEPTPFRQCGRVCWSGLLVEESRGDF